VTLVDVWVAEVVDTVVLVAVTLVDVSVPVVVDAVVVVTLVDV
jgi:hypothetical protein